MIPYRQALDLLLAAVPAVPVETVRLEEAAGRVLRQNIRADRAFPPYDRVMMDGYAFRSEDLLHGRRLRVAGSSPAGKPKASLPDETGTCLEIMTGSPLPTGADCIVPIERTTPADDGRIIVSPDFKAEPGVFIHREGGDAAKGEALLQAGALLGSREIGVAASCGVATLEVSNQPRISIIPTGDELVAVDATPEPHQIRQSNGHALRAALLRSGHAANLCAPLKDDIRADDLRGLLENNDWLIFTGAVSMGARDFLPRLLGELGCNRIFHGVAQRPGKPAGFWLGPQGQAIMALPGNPVSAIIGLHAFVLPALSVAAGLPRPATRRVIPATPLNPLPGMTLHLPVSLDEAGRAHAAPTSNSGDFIGLLRSNGFVTLPPRGDLQTAHPFIPWR